LGRLYGLVDNSQQLGMECVQVDLVSQPHRERLHGAGGVIAAPVEAPVDPVLDSAAQGANAAAALRVAAATARLPASWARRAMATTTSR
jgi:hypothetical protein